jgi:hypothetical protein
MLPFGRDTPGSTVAWPNIGAFDPVLAGEVLRFLCQNIGIQPVLSLTPGFAVRRLTNKDRQSEPSDRGRPVAF